MKINFKKIISKIKNQAVSILIKTLENQRYQKNLNLWKIKILLSHQFKNSLDYKLNLKHPQTFNEKLQWLKLFYHDPLLTKCSDKYLVRNFIKKTIGEEYLVPLIGVYNKPEEINFKKLPKRFVIKVNWGSGQNIIVKDKNKLNIKEAKAKLEKWLKLEENHYFYSFEWGYKNIKPKIIIEKYIEQSNGQVYDYKFFCFQGSPKIFYIAINSFNYSIMSINYYDIKFNLLPIKRHYPNINQKIKLPKHYKKMIELSKKLSQEFPFCRVDFFDTGKNLYVGEITFYPGGGLDSFEPKNYDLEFGKLLKLPKKKI